MIRSPELLSLVLVAVATLLMWAPYLMTRMVYGGLWATFSRPEWRHPNEPAWSERAKRAHVNAVENLAVFAPLVLTSAILGVSTPVTVLAAQIYVVARLAHYVVYAIGVPVVRTLLFLTGVGCNLAIAWVLLDRLLGV